jgi:hypothetical protein
MTVTRMTTKSTKTANTHLVPTDDELLDDLDRLVASAASGDGRAVGAIAIAFGPLLLAEARDELGPPHAQADVEVLQELCVKLLRGKLLVSGTRHDALPWLKRMMHMLAADRRGALAEAGGDLAGQCGERERATKKDHRRDLKTASSDLYGNERRD